MKLIVNLLAQGSPPPASSPVLVQLRDTSLADAPAVVIAEARTSIADKVATPFASVEFEIGTLPRGTTVWAHVDVDRDGAVSVGDYITVRSFPATSGAAALDVVVQRV